MSEGQLFILMMVVTIFACGMWAGWFAGRRHEKSMQLIKRLRARRFLSTEGVAHES